MVEHEQATESALGMPARATNVHAAADVSYAAAVYRCQGHTYDQPAVDNACLSPHPSCRPRLAKGAISRAACDA